MLLTSLGMVAVIRIAISMGSVDPLGVLVSESLVSVLISFALIFFSMFFSCLWASKTSGAFNRFLLSIVRDLR